jgi:hypothetical protein
MKRCQRLSRSMPPDIQNFFWMRGKLPINFVYGRIGMDASAQDNAASVLHPIPRFHFASRFNEEPSRETKPCFYGVSFHTASFIRGEGLIPRGSAAVIKVLNPSQKP